MLVVVPINVSAAKKGILTLTTIVREHTRRNITISTSNPVDYPTQAESQQKLISGKVVWS